MPISKKLTISIIGFNGSKNCDHSSVSAFKTSYVRRKQVIISDRRISQLSGQAINIPKHKKQQALLLEFQASSDKDDLNFLISELVKTSKGSLSDAKYSARILSQVE